jgi:leader peptidase (prepilin peptidase)/N-methyltransferase
VIDKCLQSLRASLLTIAFWTFALAASALIGSFLNVLIHRGPSMWGLLDEETRARGDLIGPRSYCPHCKHPIANVALVPVISYIALRGRCAACKAPISPRYPLVELGGVAVGAVSILVFGFTLPALFAAAFGWTLIALAAIDWETGYLPDWLTLPLLIFGLSINASSLFAPFESALVGAVAGAGVFWAIGAIWRRWRGVEALGLGDAKLVAGLGAWAGWEALPLIILGASLASLGGLFVARLRGAEIGPKDSVAFGPGLCAGGYGVFLAVQAGLLA